MHSRSSLPPSSSSLFPPPSFLPTGRSCTASVTLCYSQLPCHGPRWVSEDSAADVFPKTSICVCTGQRSRRLRINTLHMCGLQMSRGFISATAKIRLIKRTQPFHCLGLSLTDKGLSQGAAVSYLSSHLPKKNHKGNVVLAVDLLYVMLKMLKLIRLFSAQTQLKWRSRSTISIHGTRLELKG